MNTQLRVLVVDDSGVYRKIVSSVVRLLPGCSLGRAVQNGREALDALAEARFDLVLLDVEMPEMDGPTTLKEICCAYPDLPVVMISGLDERDMAKTIDALEGGALGFVTKPDTWGPGAARRQLLESLTPLIEHLINTEEIDDGPWRPLLAPEAVAAPASSLEGGPRLTHPCETRQSPAPLVEPKPKRADLGGKRSQGARSAQPKGGAMRSPKRRPSAAPQEGALLGASASPSSRTSAIPARFDLLAIGVSTGGPKALAWIFSELPQRLPVPVLIVQHMPPKFTRSLAERLNRLGPMSVREAIEGDTLEPGVALLAPGGRHMELGRSRTLHLTDAAPIKGCRPSVDALFASLTRGHPGAILTLILTGMGDDGTDGLRALGDGHYRLAQDAQSCVVYGMPRAAVEAGLIDEVHPLDQLPHRLHELLR